MAKPDDTREYVNVTAADFSPTIQQLLVREREIYDMLKACKARVVAAIREEVPAPAGREIVATSYTRWGQLQLTIADTAKPKPIANSRLSLAEWKAQQEASGARV